MAYWLATYSHPRYPLTARRLEVESYRAPHVQLHHHDLARPLPYPYRTIIELISATTTETGLQIRAAQDTRWYPKGVKITDAEMDALLLTRHDWNYTLAPTPNA
jgi:hypothetical protein